ncbi:3-phosphoshikimate 1-carboxyvinyltransferase [Leucobacter massiliensis]|uniref:3-phosphoshikimate 1-carboxyvinyltransferase n=1 Tax=Leucobacter massiliensis TaxID=1686285 RepID=A0A2S9QMP7_9MICO|nr:3-phosphoshikimate 1-carboxyvinyltransferase [Leucobacter massiliensis]PRI10837.1 3-phosphoshikimate 1-carboxyvinyltransferase [Leucobacter massiliensis]
MLEAKMNQGKDGDEARSGEGADAAAQLWPAPSGSGPLNARVSLPGSKSLTGRELVLAALADGPGVLRAPLHSRDSALMIDALRALGTVIEEIPNGSVFGPDLRVTPAAELTGSTSIACGLAGTVMRFVPPIAALALGPVAFDGDPYARKRPMRPVLDALRALGADIADEGRGALPFTVHGTGSLRGGRVELDASLSSQFVSALLLSGARFAEGVHVVHTGERVPSLPHIEMTLDTLRARGVVAGSPVPGEWTVEPGPIHAREVRIEADLSNAAPFLAAALALGGSVTVPGWPERTTQVGDQLRELLTAFGARAERGGDGALTVTAEGRPRGVRLHIPEAGELAPTLVGLAALAAHGSDGTDGEASEITGIGHIRHHETDRIAALVRELRNLGAEAEELEDGIAIRPAALHGGVWRSYADHRMATTGALIGLRVPGVEVEDVASTSKTLPQFTALWARMLGLPARDPGTAGDSGGPGPVPGVAGATGVAGGLGALGLVGISGTVAEQPALDYDPVKWFGGSDGAADA